MNLVRGVWSTPGQNAIDELRRDLDADHPEEILDAMEFVISAEKSASRVLAEAN